MPSIAKVRKARFARAALSSLLGLSLLKNLAVVLLAISMSKAGRRHVRHF